MEIKIVDVKDGNLAEVLTDQLVMEQPAPAPQSDAELLTEAASQLITIANRLVQQPPTEELEWYPNDLPESMTWPAAKEAVEKLGEGWRLPTDVEWSAEIDRSKFNPALRDPSKLPGIKSEPYWTATPDASDPQHHAWFVTLNYGDVSLYPQHYKFWVRPCRARRAPSQ